MPPSPWSGSTNTAHVLPFTMAFRAASRFWNSHSTPPAIIGRNGVLYCSWAPETRGDLLSR